MQERMTLREFAKIVFQLSKIKITGAVAFTTITGYVLAKDAFDWGFISVTVGIFLMACGSSVINHLQEYRTDSAMERTRKRPLPSGRISRFNAMIIAFVEIVAGMIVLNFLVNTEALLLGITALIWYNAIYTPMKRVTPHAVIPGSVIGAIPPLVGWVASGASLMDVRAWSMALFFFIWQVPHFYLLGLKYGPQYERAGFPSLTQRYSNKNLRILILLWVISTTFAALSLYYFDVVKSTVSVILLCLSSVWIIVIFLLPAVKKSMLFRPFRYFMRINYYVLFVILVLNFDHIFTKFLF